MYGYGHLLVLVCEFLCFDVHSKFIKSHYSVIFNTSLPQKSQAYHQSLVWVMYRKIAEWKWRNGTNSIIKPSINMLLICLIERSSYSISEFGGFIKATFKFNFSIITSSRFLIVRLTSEVYHALENGMAFLNVHINSSPSYNFLRFSNNSI